MGARAHVLAFRIGVVVSSVAALLVPGWAAPARTISVPATLARSVELSDAGPGPHSLTFSFAPTHVAFEWRAEGHDELQFRTVDEDGAFSAWRSAHADADASASDLHFSSAIAVDRRLASGARGQRDHRRLDRLRQTSTARAEACRSALAEQRRARPTRPRANGGPMSP